MAGVAIISAFYITNNAPCQKGGTLSHFFCMVHCYWQGMPVMEPCLLTLVEEEKSI